MLIDWLISKFISSLHLSSFSFNPLSPNSQLIYFILPIMISKSGLFHCKIKLLFILESNFKIRLTNKFPNSFYKYNTHNIYYRKWKKPKDKLIMHLLFRWCIIKRCLKFSATSSLTLFRIYKIRIYEYWKSVWLKLISNKMKNKLLNICSHLGFTYNTIFVVSRLTFMAGIILLLLLTFLLLSYNYHIINDIF